MSHDCGGRCTVTPKDVKKRMRVWFVLYGEGSTGIRYRFPPGVTVVEVHDLRPPPAAEYRVTRVRRDSFNARPAASHGEPEFYARQAYRTEACALAEGLRSVTEARNRELERIRAREPVE